MVGLHQMRNERNQVYGQLHRLVPASIVSNLCLSENLVFWTETPPLFFLFFPETHLTVLETPLFR